MKLLVLSLGLLIMAACNNSAKKNEKADDTASIKPSDDHGHTTPSDNNTVPELPAVPDGARVFFENLKEGETVKSPFKMKMGVEKIKIDTAGPVVAGSGHHHLIINGGPLTAGEMVPKDSLNIHYGRGQTEAEVALPPGKYSLTLQFADGLHRSYGEKMSSTIHIKVKE